MREQALCLRDELALQGAFASMTVRCAVRDRLHFGEDTVDTPEYLRPLLNRALDLVDRADLSPAQAEDLDQMLFEAEEELDT
jgi:hypothetical protein